jgi:hypothetical protein
MPRWWSGCPTKGSPIWSDHYWLYGDSPQEYDTAAGILKQALARPSLNDREYVLDRLAELYGKWGRPDAQAAVVAQRASGKSRRPLQQSAPVVVPSQVAPPAKKPGRNDPCWCGSGNKYKRCHLDVDARSKR